MFFFNSFFSYFSKRKIVVRKSPAFFLIKGLLSIPVFRSGDVISVFFFKGGSAFFFEGLCFRIRSKSFLLPDSSFSLIINLKGLLFVILSAFFIFNVFFAFFFL